MTISEAINTLGAFCGARDVPALTPAALREACGFSKADVLALFGGSVLAGVDVLAAAIRAGVAETYVIVGGYGHTTDVLRQRIKEEIPSLDTHAMREAELFNACLRAEYGLSADLLETESTNCGNNITNLLTLLERESVPCGSVILAQDATMQRRMDAGMRLHPRTPASSTSPPIGRRSWRRMARSPTPSPSAACGALSATSACCLARFPA